MTAITVGEIWPSNSEIAKTTPETYEVVAVNGLSVVVLDSRQREKELNPTNEFGVVLPPPLSECRGEECQFKKGNLECGLTQHHLHSTKPDYEDEGKLAEKFREVEALTVWLHECVHLQHHNRFIIHVPIPHPKVMRQGRYEGRKIKELVGNYRSIKRTQAELERQDLTLKAEKSLVKSIDKYHGKKESLLDTITTLKVIPEELVIGALLLTAPEFAHTRIMQGADFVLPGVIDKQEVPIVLQNAHEILAEAA